MKRASKCATRRNAEHVRIHDDRLDDRRRYGVTHSTRRDGYYVAGTSLQIDDLEVAYRHLVAQRDEITTSVCGHLHRRAWTISEPNSVTIRCKPHPSFTFECHSVGDYECSIDCIISGANMNSTACKLGRKRGNKFGGSADQRGVVHELERRKCCSAGWYASVSTIKTPAHAANQQQRCDDSNWKS